MLSFTLALFTLCVWIYLLVGRGKFWLEKPLDWPNNPSTSTPDVAIIIPARNEAATIARTVQSLLQQDYQGVFRIFVIDDHSTDNTAALASAAAQTLGQSQGLEVIKAPDLPAGWGGKVWAMQTGLDVVRKDMPKAELVLLTDADIEHGPSSLRELVCRAETGRFVLTSFMVKLHCKNFWEKIFIPAFVYFFMMLYPFAWVRDATDKSAAAAGGAMLVRRSALDTIGGFHDMHSALIDDCTLAEKLKPHGAIWLGLSAQTHSLRPYTEFSELWAMIARNAYAQLSYSPVLLLLCAFGMGFVFILPFLLFVGGDGVVQLTAFLVYFLMAFSYLPMLRHHHVNSVYALFLPCIALLYLGATLDSARAYYQGRGGLWKGRVRQS